MKIISIITGAFIFFSSYAFSFTVDLNGPSDPVRGGKFTYSASCGFTTEEEKKIIEDIQYHWTIVGSAISEKKISEDKYEVTVTMSNPKKMSENYEEWPKGFISCLVTLFFKDGTRVSSSAKMNIRLVP